MRRLGAALCLVALVLLAGCASTPATRVAWQAGTRPVVETLHEDQVPPNARHLRKAEVANLAEESNCYGDGQSGKRVQVVYLVAADRPDRYSTVAAQIRTYAANADAALNESAGKRGGTAHIRWACVGGQVDVLHFVGSTAVDDNISNSRAELQAAGYASPDRKYLIWADATAHCGIAYTVNPPEQAEVITGYGRIDTACWGFSSPVELHELVHTLGGVPLASPDSDGAWHCKSGSDRMCTTETIQRCPSSQERLLDCGNDSYYDAAADPNPMPYNIARSGYFETVLGGASPSPSPTVVPTQTSSPSTTAVPTTSLTSTATPPPTSSPTPSVTTTSAVPTPSPTSSVKCPPKSNKPACRASFGAPRTVTLTLAGRTRRLPS